MSEEQEAPTSRKNKHRHIENPNAIGSDACWLPKQPPPEDEKVHPAVHAARMRGVLR